jgi:hypothetical protein
MHATSIGGMIDDRHRALKPIPVEINNNEASLYKQLQYGEYMRRHLELS